MVREPKFKCCECGERIGLLDSYTIPGECYFDASIGMQVQPTKKYCKECFEKVTKPNNFKLTDSEIKEEIIKEEIKEKDIRRLFEILRKTRLKIAKIKGIPAYYIFEDITLKEMVSRNPKTRKEMLLINGVGEIKFEQYGEIFLEELRKREGSE